MATTTPDGVVHYTVDGSEPTPASPSAQPLVLDTPLTSTQVRAIAVAPGFFLSPTSSATYDIQASVGVPTLTPAGGTYAGSVTVTMSSSTAGATIYYTTDGSTPTTASTQLSGSSVTFATQGTVTVRAMASKGGLYADSAVSGAEVYSIGSQVSTPTFAPEDSELHKKNGGSVTISCSTPGATIYYTTGEFESPTSSSTRYTGAVDLDGDKGQLFHMRAIAVKSGWLASEVGYKSYSQGDRVEPLTISPPGGPLAPGQTVSMTTDTGGAKIYYTSVEPQPGYDPKNDDEWTWYRDPVELPAGTYWILGTKANKGDTDMVVLTFSSAQQAATPTFGVAAGTYVTRRPWDDGPGAVTCGTLTTQDDCSQESTCKWASASSTCLPS